MSIYQPGLLLCDRTESRPGEAIARFFGNMISKFTDTGSCSTWKVGSAMIQVAKERVASNEPETKFYSNNQIHAEAKKLDWSMMQLTNEKYIHANFTNFYSILHQLF